MEKDSSMDQSFLNRLNTAIENNLENEHFGVDELAHEIGISRSNLHRKLHALSGQTASQVIREFRLKEAMELLQNKVATVSEISYRVGFSNPSYFNTCFHEYFGYPPGKVKLKKPSIFRSKYSISQKHLFTLYAALAIIVLGFISYVIVSNRFINNIEARTLDKSIAIIPFKNLSEDNKNMYFVDGMTDDLLNHLSSIPEFVVKSRQSSERYRNSNKSTPQIGKELEVAYILEGSVQQYEDNIRIIVQLIDAKNDNHIWSDKYDRELMNVFAIQSEISKQIAHELKTVLSPGKMKQIEKEPTESIEAYNLYLKGRHFWHQRTKKDLEKSIICFNKALELDSDYALAYAGLADAYYIMTWWGWYPLDDGYAKSINLAEQSLKLDDQIVQAHATLGAIFIEKHNFSEAEKKLKQAIELNPSYATAYLYYSGLLRKQGNLKEARKMIDLALMYNPFSPAIHAESLWNYYDSGYYKEALNEGLLVKELDENHQSYRWAMFFSYFHLEQYDEAIKELQVFVFKEGFSNTDTLEIRNVYINSGIDGALNLMIDHFSNQPKILYIFLARLDVFLGKKEEAISLLEAGFHNRDYGRWIDQVELSNRDYQSLHSHPRFISLLGKIKMEE